MGPHSRHLGSLETPRRYAVSWGPSCSRAPQARSSSLEAPEDVFTGGPPGPPGGSCLLCLLPLQRGPLQAGRSADAGSP